MRATVTALVMLCAGGVTLAQEFEVAPWRVPGIASSLWESHPAIDPATGELWFVRSDKTFAGWRIFRSRCENGRWSAPQQLALAGEGLEADPWFSPDTKTLWFISTGPSTEVNSAALDIWRAERGPNGSWQRPERLPAPVNSTAAEWFPRPAADGWLYFGSRRDGGLGKDDIWRAKQAPDGHWMVENAGPTLNSDDAEYEFQPAPDGSWGILATSKGLYRVVNTTEGWHRDEKLGPAVNVNGTEIGPMITDDARSFVFSRDAGERDSGELFIARPRATSAGEPRWNGCAAAREDWARSDR